MCMRACVCASKVVACPPSRVLCLSVRALVLKRFYAPGMPADTPTFNKSLCEESQGFADKWAMYAAAGAGEGRGFPDPEKAKFAAWPSPQKVRGGQAWGEGSGGVTNCARTSMCGRCSSNRLVLGIGVR